MESKGEDFYHLIIVLDYHWDFLVLWIIQMENNMVCVKACFSGCVAIQLTSDTFFALLIFILERYCQQRFAVLFVSS